MKTELLQKIASELNETIGLNPNIDLEHGDKNLTYLIKKASSIVLKDDIFSADVAEGLIEIGGLSDNVVTAFELGSNLSDDVIEQTVKEETAKSEELSNAKPPEPVETINELEPETAKPAEADKAKKNAPEKPKVPQPKKKKKQPHINRIEELITEAKYTSQEIVSIIIAEFPKKREDTITTYVRSTKNPKYNPFEQTVIEDDNKIFKFVGA